MLIFRFWFFLCLEHPQIRLKIKLFPLIENLRLSRLASFLSVATDIIVVSCCHSSSWLRLKMRAPSVNNIMLTNQKSTFFKVAMNPPRRTTVAQTKAKLPSPLVAFSRIASLRANRVIFFSGAVTLSLRHRDSRASIISLCGSNGETNLRPLRPRSDVADISSRTLDDSASSFLSVTRPASLTYDFIGQDSGRTFIEQL